MINVLYHLCYACVYRQLAHFSTVWGTSKLRQRRQFQTTPAMHPPVNKSEENLFAMVQAATKEAFSGIGDGREGTLHFFSRKTHLGCFPSRGSVAWPGGKICTRKMATVEPTTTLMRGLLPMKSEVIAEALTISCMLRFS